MRTFSELRELAGRKPIGKAVFDKKINRVPVKIHNEKNKFVEPFIPNHNIGVMHLAGLDEDRKTNIIHKIKTTDNKIVEKSLRYLI